MNFTTLIMLIFTAILAIGLVSKGLIFESRNLSDKNIHLINTALQQINWDDKLSGVNCNENYNTFTTLINTTMEKYSPLQKIRISSKRIYIEPWMSRGLEISSKKRHTL